MTLKEKLKYEIGDNCENSSYCNKKSCQTENGVFCFVDKQTIENCEQIAEEFAIGFAEWIIKGKIDKERLEIYKKEKNL